MDGEAAAREHRGTGGSRPQDPGALFLARPGGVAQAVGTSLGARRPLATALVIWVAAFILLGAAIIGLGLLLTRVLLGAGLDGVDTDVMRWFVAERIPTLDTLSRWASGLGSTGVILAVSAVTGIVLVLTRHWRQFGFLLFALTLEFSLFLLTVTIINRNRPDVAQLDAAPPTSSFPSGHTAAAWTLYLGLAIVTSSLVRGGLVRALAWTAAIALPLLVAVSRLYRGMHFPTDVIAGALLAGAVLLIAVFAVRSTVAATAERERRAAEHDRPATGSPAGNPQGEVVS
jgi:membrane-associated phospholipid phosphatase